MCLWVCVGYWKDKSNKSPVTDQIPAELIIAGSKAFGCEILILIISNWNKEELPEEWKESIIVAVDKKSDKTECSNYRRDNFFQQHTKFYSPFCRQDLLHMNRKLLGIISVDLNATDLQVSIYCALWNTWEMGIYWSRASAVYRLRESLWFS